MIVSNNHQQNFGWVQIVMGLLGSLGKGGGEAAAPPPPPAPDNSTLYAVGGLVGLMAAGTIIYLIAKE